nr:tetratricopeptide repeat protein [candidate division Zixibacteria bacterium]
MGRRKNTVSYIFLAVGLMMVLGWGCSGKSDKIPITTSSPEARQDYIKGRDLGERLRALEATDYLNKAIEKDPNFAMAYLNLAYLQSSVKGYYDMFEKAYALRNQISEGEQLMLHAARAGNNADPMKQLEYLQQLVAEYPNDERAHNILGTYWYGQQEFQKAISELERAININDEFSPAYNMLGYCYRYLGQYDKAEEAFIKYIELIPDDPNPYDSYAELRLKMGEYGQSIETYYEALDIDPNFVPSHIGIATNLNYLGKHKSAREQLQELYDIARDDGQRRTALQAMVISYVDEGKMDQALLTMDQQYNLSERMNDITAMTNDLAIMSRILLEMNQSDRARVMIDSSHNLFVNSDLPDELKANSERNYLYFYARIAIKRGDFAEAGRIIQEFKTRVEEANNPYQTRQIHELAGMLALEQADYSTALTEFSQADQQSPYLFYLMGKACEGNGDMTEALDWYEKVAYFNDLNSLSYSFIRQAAIKKLPRDRRR